jgi:protein SCO1/2
VFVSVDPKRDTPQKIAEYVKLFDGSIMGLTGKDENDEDYRRMLDSFKVYANKIKGE